MGKGEFILSIFEKEGVKLYYELRGKEDAKETVVFLNGVMASTNSWYTLSKPLEELGYRVLLHDFKGQLKSDKPEGPYSFLDHAKELLALLDHLNIHKAHVIGTSYGGEVALRFATAHPERMDSMVVIDSTSELTGVCQGFVSSWMAPASAGDGEAFFNTLMPSIYGESFLKKEAAFLKKRAKATKDIGEDYFHGQVTLYETFLQDVAMDLSELQKIQVPTLVICGEQDILKTPKESLRIHQGIEGSEYVLLPDCGHVSIFEKPKEITTLLLGFLLKHKS